MARSIGDGLPDTLLDILDGSHPEMHVGFTIMLATVTNSGWSHLALLSVGEAVAIDPGEVRLALWESSSAAANLGQVGRATMACVYNGAAYSIRCHATHTGALSDPDIGTLAIYRGVIEEVFEDVAPYAVLEHGVRYRLTDQVGTLERWKNVIAHLKTVLL